MLQAVPRTWKECKTKQAIADFHAGLKEKKGAMAELVMLLRQVTGDVKKAVTALEKQKEHYSWLPWPQAAVKVMVGKETKPQPPPQYCSTKKTPPIDKGALFSFCKLGETYASANLVEMNAWG
eukprot:1870286-Amphidinium_carterae.1